MLFRLSFPQSVSGIDIRCHQMVSSPFSELTIEHSAMTALNASHQSANVGMPLAFTSSGLLSNCRRGHLSNVTTGRLLEAQW